MVGVGMENLELSKMALGLIVGEDQLEATED